MNYKITPTEPDYTKASNLVFASIAVGLVISAINYPIFIYTFGFITITTILSISLWIGIAVLIRNKVDWARYVLLVFASLSIISTVISLSNIIHFPFTIIIGFIRTLLQVLATVMLFRKELDRL